MSSISPEQLRRLVNEDRDKFIQSQFKIVTRTRGMRPLKFNKVQNYYWANKTTRDVFLKARQLTVSTILHADLISEAMLKPGLKGLILVQKPEDETLGPHRERARLFYNSTHELFRPQLLIDSTHQMKFGFPGGYSSTIYFGSAGSLSIGRGETIHRAILEEFGEWEDIEARAILRTLLGMPDDSIIKIVGTPTKASGAFFEVCRNAKRGFSPFKLHVLPWWLEESYYTEGLLTEPTPEELHLLQKGLKPEQILWRRKMMRMASSFDTKLSRQTFLNEYLENDISCWNYTGVQVFDPDVLMSLLPGTIPPVQTQLGGNLRIWSTPEPGKSYVIGADPAQGVAEGNLSAAVVRETATWKHVASLRGLFPPQQFAEILVKLGSYYNTALIVPERNNHGHAVILALRTLSNYPLIYIHYKNIEVGGDDNFGVPTNIITKPFTVTREKELVASGLFDTKDEELLQAMLAYQEISQDKFEGEGDDLVIADIMALQGRSQALNLGIIGKKSEAYGPAWARKKFYNPDGKKNYLSETHV